MLIFILLVSIAYTSLTDHHGISAPVVFLTRHRPSALNWTVDLLARQ